MARWGMALTLVLLSTSGCFRYIPVELETLPPGENVRVYVSRSVIQQLQEVGDFTDPVVRGRIVRRNDEELFVWVPIGARQVGFHSTELGQDVRIPLTEIVQLERREIDRIGTGALVAGGIGTAAVVLFVIMEAFGDMTNEGDCSDCPDLLTPRITLPIRR
jgi:hypothetical protein